MRSCHIRHQRVEALLQRALLSVSVVKETLSIEGTAGKDEIVVGVLPANQMSVKVNGEERIFRLGRFKVINVQALGGDDRVRIGDLGAGHPAFLNIDLGAGNDRVDGSGGAERIFGASGNDRISAGAGADYVDAGSGDDVVVGGAGRDTLLGLEGNDSLYGGDGNDNVAGGAGHDSLDGSAGDDTINGGDGNDRISENDPAVKSPAKYYDKIDFKNVIDGAGGDDFIEIRGYGGLSRVYGGDGNDYLIGENQFTSTYWRPTVYGGNGNDKLIGAHCYGGAGNDKIASIGVLYSIALHGEEGDDVISSTISNADGGSIIGGDGNDVIDNVTLGLWKIDGGGGDDQITTQSGSADGGAGDDVIRAKVPDRGQSTRSSTEHRFTGGSGDDLIYGCAFGETLDGGDGRDTLHGLDGNDLLLGGDGVDVIFGGNSQDTIGGGEGDDSLSGGAYRDKTRSDDGADYLLDQLGEDRLDPDHDWWDEEYPPSHNNGGGVTVVGTISSGSSFTISGPIGYSYPGRR